MFEIQGRAFSEETIVAALKAYTDWPEEHRYRAGDIVKTKQCGLLRLVVKDGLYNLMTINEKGMPMVRGKDVSDSLYIYVGRCVGFEVAL